MGRGTAAIGSFPPINIFQKDDDFVAVVELPGIDKNDLEIEAKENTIRIRGKKTIAYGEQASVHRRERISGVFDRTLSVPISNRTRSHQGRISRWDPCAVHTARRGRQAALDQD